MYKYTYFPSIEKYNLAVGAAGLKNPYDKDFALGVDCRRVGYEHGLVGDLQGLLGG